MAAAALRTSLTPSGLALALLFAGACQSPQQAPDPARLPPGLAAGSGAEDVELDRSVEEHLAQLIRSSRVVDGLRVVEIDLRNRGGEELEFAYSVEWLDRQGATVVDLEAEWTTLSLAGGESAPIEFRAPSTAADSWRLVAVALED